MFYSYPMRRAFTISSSAALVVSLLALSLIIVTTASANSGYAVLSGLSINSIRQVGPLTEYGSASRVPQYNVILVVLDDWGKDGWDGGGIGSNLPHTPTMNALASQGVVFPNFWIEPVCCSARTEILTGQFSFRNGVGKILDSSVASEYEMQTSAVTLPEAIKLGTNNQYKTVAIGKWHLTHDPNGPAIHGFDYYAGSLWNLGDIKPPNIPGVNSYFNYYWTVNGQTSVKNTYATTQTANEAISWLNTNQQSPFFMYLAFNAPHTPLHVPPANLHYQAGLSNCVNKRACYTAMIEAADTELGRVLASLSPDVRSRTMIMVTGDNGTPDQVIIPPFDSDRGKGSVYEEGIAVPLIVNGPLVGVPGSTSQSLVSGADFYVTITKILGFNVRSPTVLSANYVLDSRTFLNSITNPTAVSTRKYSLAEHFQPNGLTEGYPKTTPTPPVCQTPLMSYQGPGTASLSICGDYLDLGASADISITNTFPLAPVTIYASTSEDPVPQFGGTTAPQFPPEITLTGQTDSQGTLLLPDAVSINMADFQQPNDWYYQAVIENPAQPGNYQLTNAVHVVVNQEPNIKAIRNEAIPGKCYKLIVSVNANPQHEELYKLCTDPFEQNDLLANGPLTPGTEAYDNYHDLRNKLDEWLQ